MANTFWSATQNVASATQDAAENWIQHFLSNASSYTIKVVWAILAFLAMMVLAGIVARLVRKAIVKHSSDNDENAQKVGNLIRDIVYYIMIWFAVFVAFEVLWFDLWLLLWWVSFGIWLAFKQILGNMIAGIMILYTKEIKLGDVIEVKADQDYFGRVEEITIRYTIVRTLDLRQVVIPNLTLISVPIKTFSSEQLVRLNTVIWVHYDSDIEKAVQVIIQAINTLPFVLEKNNTSVFVKDFWESSVDLKCLFFFDPNSGLVWDYAVWQVNKAIHLALGANNILIPYPHTTILFASKEDQEKITWKV